MTTYSEPHGVSYFLNKGRSVFGYVSNWHNTEEEGPIRRRLKRDGVWVEEEINVSTSAADYNKGGFPNVDAGDGTIAKAGIQHRKSKHFWRNLLDCVIFHILALHAFLLWRVLHPELKITCRQFLLKIAEKSIQGSTFFQRKRQMTNIVVPVSLRGKKRFTGKTISNLSVSEIRAEMGPRKHDFDPMASARAATMRNRAKTCMNYRPMPTASKGYCAMANCKGRPIYRCKECGAFGCFKLGKNHLDELHIRYNKAQAKMKRAL